MRELKRVLLNKRALIFLLLAVALSCVFFVYECGSDKKITASGAELTAYIESYPEFLRGVGEKAETLSLLSISNGAFYRENIKKTAADYAALSNITVSVGNNRAIVAYSDYIVGDLALLVFVAFIALSFTRERKKGLDLLIHSTAHGRARLALCRLGIMSVAAVGGSLLITLSLALAGGISCGGFEPTRALQSVPEFMSCAAPINIGEYFLFSALLKALAAFFFGALFCLLSACLPPTAAIILSALSLAAEYLLFLFIMPTDRLAWLKYANAAALLRADAFFKGYCNLDFFGAPLGFMLSAIVAVTFAAAVLTAALVFASGLPVVKPSGLLDRISHFFSKRRRGLPLFLWECKKLLIKQKGLLIIAIVICIALSSALKYSYVYPEGRYVGAVWDEFGGREINAELTAALSAKHTDAVLAVEAIENELNLLYESPDYSFYRAEQLKQKLEEAKKQLSAVAEVKEISDSGYSYTLESGRNVRLIRQTAYNVLLSLDKATTDKNSFLVLLAMLGALAGSFASEYACGMDKIIALTRRGRRGVVARKLGLAAIIAFVLSLSVNLTQLLSISADVGFDEIFAPAQSILRLQGFPLGLSVFGFLILMYVVRALFAFAVGAAVMGISRLCKSTVVAAGVSAAVIALPALLGSVLSIPSLLNLLSYSG